MGLGPEKDYAGKTQYAGTHFIQVLLGPRAGVDVMGRENFCPPGIELRLLGLHTRSPVVIPSEFYLYPDCDLHRCQGMDNLLKNIYGTP
jgi:hypothetical protein